MFGMDPQTAQAVFSILGLLVASAIGLFLLHKADFRFALGVSD